jgi:hypothetical protein
MGASPRGLERAEGRAGTERWALRASREFRGTKTKTKTKIKIKTGGVSRR